MIYLASVKREKNRVLAEFPDAPGCQTFASNMDELEVRAKEALEGWLESWLVEGDTPPRPKRRTGRGLAIEVDAALALALELRWARVEAGLTQADLAARAGVSQQQIAKLERPGQNPSIETIKKVAYAMGANPVVSLERRGGSMGSAHPAKRAGAGRR